MAAPWYTPKVAACSVWAMIKIHMLSMKYPINNQRSAANAKLDLSGRSQTLAGLAGGGTVYSFNSTASTLTLNVRDGESHVFSGNLGSDDPTFGFTKSGDGTQTLSGANTYTRSEERRVGKECKSRWSTDQ